VRHQPFFFPYVVFNRFLPAHNFIIGVKIYKKRDNVNNALPTT
jgi:hypothetical protein